MLTQYQTTTQALLQNPSVNAQLLYPTNTLTTFINLARAQTAIEGECIRIPATLALTNGTNSYAFSAVNTSPATGIKGPISVRLCSVSVGGVPTLLDPRPYEWMFTYYLSNGTAVATGTPQRWAQQGQGANGTLYFNPTPNTSFTVTMDIVALPIDLVDDTTSEAIPYPWTDCIPYYAAYYALISAQRQSDANLMMERYKEYARRARDGSTSTVLPANMPGGPGAQMAASKSTLTTAQGGQQ